MLKNGQIYFKNLAVFTFNKHLYPGFYSFFFGSDVSKNNSWKVRFNNGFIWRETCRVNFWLVTIA